MPPGTILPEHVRNIELFAGLTLETITSILEAGHLREFAAGAVIFAQGDAAETVFLLARGRVRLGQVTEDGQQIVLRYALPGTVFGLVGMVSRGVYPVTADALDPSAALAWAGERLRQFARVHPALTQNAMRQMSEMVGEFQARYRTLATERVERRIARTLLRLVRQAGRDVPQGVLIDLALRREDLAQMCATNMYTVSRTLANWERQGIVDSGREKVIILNPHGLVQIAEDLPPRSPADSD